MELLIFKTDIKTKKKVKMVKPLLINASFIKDWSIDTEDIDNVMRIETIGNLNESDIIRMMNTCGFQCEALVE